jgi:hypothetical protein
VVNRVNIVRALYERIYGSTEAAARHRVSRRVVDLIVARLNAVATFNVQISTYFEPLSLLYPQLGGHGLR